MDLYDVDGGVSKNGEAVAFQYLSVKILGSDLGK